MSVCWVTRLVDLTGRMVGCALLKMSADTVPVLEQVLLCVCVGGGDSPEAVVRVETRFLTLHAYSL